MTRLWILLVSVSLLFTACSKQSSPNSKAQEVLLGRWWSMAGAQRVTMEFAQDGTYKTTLGGQTTNGTYRWLDDTTLELNHAQKVKVAIADGELTMVIGNETSRFQRESQSMPQGGSSPSTPGASPSGIIKQAVLARGIAPLSRSAVEATDKFPANQGSLWVVVTAANAPQNTRVKGVMIAVDTGNAIAPNTKVGENEASVQGSDTVGLGWPTYNGAPAGAYRIDLYVNGNLDRSLPFSMSAGVAPFSAPAANPASMGSCPQVARNDSPPGFAIGVTLAQGRDGAGNPVNPGRIFPPNATFYALVNTQNAPVGTKLAARWFATDVGGADICNAQFANYEMTVSGSGTPWFSATPPISGSSWPEGLYRVEVYVNGTKTLTTDFAVCNGSCKFKLPFPS